VVALASNCSTNERRSWGQNFGLSTEDLRHAWAWKYEKDRNEGQVKKTNSSDENDAKSQKHTSEISG